MLTDHEIETYAELIDAQGLEEEAHLLKHLDPLDRRAVLLRFADMKSASNQSLAIVALARAYGCPDGVPTVEWLIEHGVIEIDAQGIVWVRGLHNPDN